MDYQLAQKIKNCFYYRGTPADAYKLVEDNLNSIDFDDDDDVSELFEILEYALTSKNDDDENSEEGADGLKFLEFLIKKGFDINFKLLKKKCFILYLADRSWLKPDVFRKVVELGADVYSTDAYNNGVLTLAAHRENDNAENLAVFIAQAYDVAQLEHPDQYGITPLMYAVITKKRRLAETLIKRGVDVNEKGGQPEGGAMYWMKTYGVTPFALACREGDFETAKMLLDAGADETITDAEGTPASFSLVYNSFKFNSYGYAYTDKILQQKGQIAELLKRPDVTDTDGNTLLLKTLSKYEYRNDIRVNPSNNYPIMQAIIKNGADVNAVNRHGDRPIHLAIQYCDEVLKDLLSAGADINAQDADGNTALIIECKEYNEKGARTLLRKGADFTIKNNKGETAADIAAANGLTDVLELMI